MQLIHAAHSSPTSWTLDDYRDQIVREIDGVALRVGALLREAKQRDPDNFARWVDLDLPFGAETAKRLMAISSAYEKLPPDRLRLLPRPWQAMYALKALPPSTLMAGMDSGEINPDMTVRSAVQFAGANRGGTGLPDRIARVDELVGRLMQFSPNELNPGVRAMLMDWVRRAS